MDDFDISTRLLTDINNMDCEKTRLHVSYTLKTNTPNSLQPYSLNSVIIFVNCKIK